MKIAILSDIHGNLEALEAVLADLHQQHVAETIYLGDIVGYGPNPCECLDLVMRNRGGSVLGNHDLAMLYDPQGFRRVAMQAVLWTRRQLNTGSTEEVRIRWDFIRQLRESIRHDGYLFVHGSAQEPTYEYVFPEDAEDPEKMEEIFRFIDKYCFQGHTHIPGIFTSKLKFISPGDCDYFFRLGPERLMINVGSVGQPRDNDPRACYVVLDKDEHLIHFRRVWYNAEVTRQKVYDIPELDNSLGDRLLVGR